MRGGRRDRTKILWPACSSRPSLLWFRRLPCSRRLHCSSRLCRSDRLSWTARPGPCLHCEGRYHFWRHLLLLHVESAAGCGDPARRTIVGGPPTRLAAQRRCCEGRSPSRSRDLMMFRLRPAVPSWRRPGLWLTENERALTGKSFPQTVFSGHEMKREWLSGAITRSV